MLISISATNFKSLRDRTTLRMDASADTDLPEVVRTDIPGIEPMRGILPVASIHGANASGKSNLIKAARLLDELVTIAIRFPEGRIPEEYPAFYNPARLVDPFRLDDTTAAGPTTLEVMCMIDGVKWLYAVSSDGKKIHSECLLFWPNGRRVELFTRGCAIESDKNAWLLDRSEVNESSEASHVRRKRIAPEMEPERWKRGTVQSATPQQECWSWGNEFQKGESEGQALAGRTRVDVPYLSVAASWNHPQAIQVINWFSRFVILDATQSPARAAEIASRACEANSDVHQWAERWMRAADFGISSIAIEKTEETLSNATRSRYQPKAMHTSSDGRLVAFEMSQESHGTNRIFSMAPTLFNTLTSGGVLLVDELHSGLHPLLLRALVKLFQSKSRNPNNAQLIFTTHDVSVLDNSLLRRDQIHIVEKGNDGSSDLYSLSDCDDKPRKNAPLVKYYLAGHLGGVPDLDIDSLFPVGQ